MLPRWPKGVEEWIVFVVIIVMAALLLFFLVGCAKQQKVSNFDVLWSGEKCLFHSAGMTIEQADKITKEWDFENCEVNVTTGDQGKPKPPPKD